LFSPALPPSTDHLQSRLLLLAGLFLGIYSLILTLSPAARFRSWQVTYRWDHWIGLAAWVLLFYLADRLTRRTLPGRDPYLLPVAALLAGWGLLTIWRLYPGFGLRQTVWLAAGMLLLMLGLRLPGQLGFLRRYKYLWLFTGLVLTALTLLLGTNPAAGSGPRLWLGCCGVYLQPSEPLKLLLIVYLAAYLADRLPQISLESYGTSGRWSRLGASLLPLLLPTLLVTGLTLLLLLVQRDLGTATIFLFIYAVIVYLATGRAAILVYGGVTLAAAALAGYFLFEVVSLRIDAWLNPWLDPSGRSFQIVQSMISLASGGLAGRGPGMGSPSLVPIAHSDFIFAALSEETGLLGAIGLLVLLGLLCASGLRIALQAPDAFRRFLAAGLTAYLVAQSILIVGGNLRLMPLTGVTLPFVSYGGSSLVTALLALLFLLHISQRGEESQSFLPDSRPYLYLGGSLLVGLAGLAVLAGWWSLLRGPDLVARTDNPRRAIADRYVPRGALLDRHNLPLSATEGTTGDLVRRYLYPELAPTLGYTDPRYGQAGLEASLDPYLRGLRGNPDELIWWDHVLYGQPPPGVDVRLSLDLDLQRTADRLLGRRAGAIVLLNAGSGEILALASHPTFDPNRLEQDWAALVADPATPLLNRAIQGRYALGNVMGGLLLAAALARADLPAMPAHLDLQVQDRQPDCARAPAGADWGPAIAAGCPAPQAALEELLGSQALLDLYQQLNLNDPPLLDFPAESPATPEGIRQVQQAALDRSEVSVSPLQMALAAAALSAGGEQPVPQLVSAYKNPEANWERLQEAQEPARLLPGGAAQRAAEALALKNMPTWQSLAYAPGENGRNYTWYLGGTLPDWTGAPLALAIILEEDNPALAEVIGQGLLSAALQLR
jgi:cell division protein FtsW (lipid II flippase)